MRTSSLPSSSWRSSTAPTLAPPVLSLGHLHPLLEGAWNPLGHLPGSSQSHTWLLLSWTCLRCFWWSYQLSLTHLAYRPSISIFLAWDPAPLTLLCNSCALYAVRHGFPCSWDAFSSPENPLLGLRLSSVDASSGMPLSLHHLLMQVFALWFSPDYIGSIHICVFRLVSLGSYLTSSW